MWSKRILNIGAMLTILSSYQLAFHGNIWENTSEMFFVPYEPPTLCNKQTSTYEPDVLFEPITAFSTAFKNK